MKAKVIAREPLFKKFFDAKEKLAEDIRAVVSGNDFLFRGIFWGVAVAALIVGVINLQKINHMNKAATDTISTLLETDVEGIKDSEFYVSLESSVQKDLQPVIEKYVKNYLKSKKYSEFFDKTTKEAFAKEIEQMLMKEVTETNALTKNQEKEISKLISEKIAAIDYSQIEAKIQDSISKMENHTNLSVEEMEQKILGIVGSKADENVASIVREINSTDRGLQIVINDLQTKIEQENKLRDEYNNAKFEAVMNQMDENYVSLSDQSTENFNVLTEHINTNYETTNSKIDNNYETTNSKIDSNYESTNSKIDNNYKETNGKIDANYDELIKLLEKTNGRISDPGNGEYFQYGYDGKNGMAGYYLNDEFKPF